MRTLPSSKLGAKIAAMNHNLTFLFKKNIKFAKVTTIKSSTITSLSSQSLVLVGFAWIDGVLEPEEQSKIFLDSKFLVNVVLDTGEGAKVVNQLKAISKIYPLCLL
ncbi:MAG: hypothetical protein F6K14_25540 [Symploca sp. SIO2C1]|nr:hypothetical protein [Symploca sp. SIO2C1]